MGFTEEERAEWHRAKQEREAERPTIRAETGVDCIICFQPILQGMGDWTSEYPICVACDGD